MWYRGGRIDDGVSSGAWLLRRTWSHEQGEGKKKLVKDSRRTPFIKRS